MALPEDGTVLARANLMDRVRAAFTPRVEAVAVPGGRDARLEHAAITHQAQQFFGCKLGFTVDKKYDPASPPRVDAVRVIVASDDGSASGTRLVFGRPVTNDDLALAADAETRSHGSGLSLLAQRCPTMWLVIPESGDDRVALTIAAIFASTMLGPILSPSGFEIFGVRTARLKLEAPKSPYR